MLRGYHMEQCSFKKFVRKVEKLHIMERVLKCSQYIVYAL